MRRVFLIMALIAIALPTAGLAAPAEGYWKTIDDETGKAKSIVKVYVEDGTLYGKVVELLNRPEGDENPVCEDCEGSRKDQPIKGMVFLWGMKKDDDVWEDGTILDPANGKTYDCKVWLEDGKLMVRGYVGFFYRTQEWLPVDRASVED